MSTIAMLYGLAPVVKSTFAAKEEVLIAPELAVFCSTDTLPAEALDAMISGFPSPFTSAMATA